MPIKLIDPRPGKTPYYAGRGTHFGVYVNERSTKARDRRTASKIVRAWERDIERRVLAGTTAGAEAARPLIGFADAALAYMRAGGELRYIEPLLRHFRDTPIASIDQIKIDEAADKLMPGASAPTKNRMIYTPIAAVLHHGGSSLRVRRPKGWRGNKSTSWLEPGQAFAVLRAAAGIDSEFELLLRTLLYTGMRISEALSAELRALNLQTGTLYLPETKNGEARAVRLPPHLVRRFKMQPPRPKRVGGRMQVSAGVPFLGRPPTERIFRFHRSGALRKLLDRTFAVCKLQFPPRQGGFHLFCHTWGTWMHRYGGLDTFGLTRTRRWKSPQSTDRYRHTGPSEEALRADLLPVPKLAEKLRKIQ